MKLSIVIPVYNSEKTLSSCLKSIYKSAPKNSEIIIVDDCSTDSSINIAKKFKSKIIKLKTKSGAAAARNIGIKKAKNDIILFIDSDMIITENSFKELIKTFSNKAIDGVIGNYSNITINKNLLTNYQNLYTHYNYLSIGREKIVQIKNFWTAFGAIKTKILKQNLFDPSFKGLEDIEIGLRLADKGYKLILNKNIQNIHNNYYNLKKFIKNYYSKSKAWLDISIKKGLLKYEGYDNLAKKLSLISVVLFIPSLFFIKLVPYLPLIPLILFILSNLKFYIFLFKQRNLKLGLACIPLSLFSYHLIELGLIIEFFKKINKLFS